MGHELTSGDWDDADPSFASPKRPTSKPEIEKVLAGIAADAGGELRVDDRERTVGPIPSRLPDGSFVNGTCPRCGGDQFAHSYGDELCGCARCGAVLDVDELVV